jgi:heme/copper-type cytochrome/quinol oxidase subunit 4
MSAPGNSSTREQDMDDVKRHVRQHIIIAVALAIGSLTTIWTSQTHFGNFAVNVAMTLLVAGVQGFMVAGYYMHLLSEKKMIYSFLIFTAFFFVVMIGITFWARMPSNVVHISQP